MKPTPGGLAKVKVPRGCTQRQSIKEQWRSVYGNRMRLAPFPCVPQAEP